MVAIPQPPAEKNASVHPDLDETVRFLKVLPGNGNETLVAIGLDGKLLVRTFTSTDGMLPHDKVRDWLEPLQSTHNCYFQVNVGKEGKKATKDEITHVRMQHVDIDDLGALDRLEKFPVRPSAIIMSGGGYQAFWFYEQPRPIDPQYEDINDRIRLALGADHCHNIDRIMRLPGTLNVPDAKKRQAGRTTICAKIVRMERLFYEPADFNSIHRTAIISTRIDGLPADSVELSDELRERIRIGNTDKKYPSRSEAVWRVTCSLVREEVPDETIVGLLLHPDNKISESILERADPQAEAIRQLRRAKEAVSTGWPEVTGKGPKAFSYRNTRIAVNRLGIEGMRDVFHDREYLLFPNEDFIRYTDFQVRCVRDLIIDNYRFDPGIENVFNALNRLCDENEVHPIRDAFPRMQWDGTKRLQYLFSYYFGAEDTPFTREISEIILVAAVRRIREPGCKFDTIPVLESPQGEGKSTGLSILAGKDNFSDQELLVMDARAQAEALRGVWIYEIAELQGLQKADVDHIKSFASRSMDMVRPAYARKREDTPRQTVFVGTTNESTYLRDSTGNRRFWPIKCGKVRLETLRSDRLQLLAEAVALEAAGRSIVLDESLWSEAGEIQRSRLVGDSWADELRNIGCYFENGTLRVSSQDVLAHLGRSADKQSQNDFRRAAEAMRFLGWKDKLVYINGKTVRGFEADPDVVPHVLIPDDPGGGRPPYLRVVDENFTVGGKPLPTRE